MRSQSACCSFGGNSQLRHRKSYEIGLSLVYAVIDQLLSPCLTSRYILYYFIKDRGKCVFVKITYINKAAKIEIVV